VYQAGFSSTLRWITAGTWVPWYPSPIIEVSTVLRPAIARSSATTSGSLIPGPRARASSRRIEAGTAARTSEARSAWPIVASMAFSSAVDGPM
jgi:hypothetical protein